MNNSVLIVEDDPLIRKGMMALLRSDGHAAVGAASVAEAASQLDDATSTHLLLDLNLPDGPGTHVLRRIRAQSLAVRVALITGASDTMLTDEARALGVDAIFIKPPDWDKVLNWVARPESE